MCLLELAADKLKLLFDRADLERLGNAEFRRILKGNHVPYVADQPPLGAAIEDEPMEFHADAPLALPARGLSSRGIVPMLSQSFKIGVEEICLDNWSHNSGQRRAYITCGLSGPRHWQLSEMQQVPPSVPISVHGGLLRMALLLEDGWHGIGKPH